MIILYPTETIYALGVNAFDKESLAKLFSLKGREETKAVSVLVRDLADIERYAFFEPKAQILAKKWLPGPFTLVLRARDEVPRSLIALDGTLGFRISSDQIAQKLISDFMEEYQAPLTCTSANLSGQPTMATVPEILAQFSDQSQLIDKIYDDGARSGQSSTVVQVIDNEVKVLRQGVIDPKLIYLATED